MLYWDLLQSLQFNAPSANSSSQSSFLVSSSMMRQTELGGLANGTDEVWGPMSCPSQLESSSSKLLSWAYGHPTSSLPTSSSLFSHPSPLFHTSTLSTRRSCVSQYYPASEVMLIVPLVWLRPSKQIRAPLYSMKVKKQRQWIVIKYGIIYLCVAGTIVALVVIRRSLLFTLSPRC